MLPGSSIVPSQAQSGITTVIADKCYVSPPEITKRPLDIFEQFLRVPSGISVYGKQGWTSIDDQHVPGTESFLRYLRSRANRPAFFDVSSTFYVRPRARPRRVVVQTSNDQLYYQKTVKRKKLVLFQVSEAPVLYHKGPAGRGIKEAKILTAPIPEDPDEPIEPFPDEGKLQIIYTDDTEYKSEMSLIGERGLPGEPGPIGPPGVTTTEVFVIPFGVGFDSGGGASSVRGPRGQRGNDGKRGRSGILIETETSGVRGARGQRGSDGADGQRGKNAFQIETLDILSKKGRKGRDGRVFLLPEESLFPTQKRLTQVQNQSKTLLSVSPTFVTVRPQPKPYPRPNLLSLNQTFLSNPHKTTQKFLATLNLQQLHYVEKKTLRKLAGPQISVQRSETYVTQKFNKTQKFSLQTLQNTTALCRSRNTFLKKTSLLQRTDNFTSVKHVYHRPVRNLIDVTHQYVTYNTSRIERLLQNRPFNSLNFQSGSSLTLTGDASVTMN
jgi:hypothetical protein